ncbi:sterol desaturase family protein [Sphingomicrobium astaxanthinifaciens]|uniref:sterol desaturase family protein n=1 Tax=Sphingomicrobium astaxanthinifaciens TaxID=1227949 RepID=UPI001FCA5068|nr:sterol desaturase family protein [Sphingomicrobium astaxanthinifaciens]MCJ7422408.1 sterol desaturase family protein [Sphingomicrobium astaxanthinifaciens]
MSFAFLSTFPVWQGLLIALGVVVAMEATAYAVHRWVMHGPLGWGWHASHHAPRTGLFERNDLYAVVFALLAIGLFTAGALGPVWAWYVGLGTTLYGILYFIAHDGLVHQRWPFRIVPKSGYLQRLYQAHRLHHAVDGRDGCVSFGFLYAPPVRVLKARLRRHHPRGVRDPEDVPELRSGG